MFNERMIENVKFFIPPFLSVGLWGVSLATIGSVISIVAGVLGIFYTTIKIYYFLKEKRGK